MTILKYGDEEMLQTIDDYLNEMFGTDIDVASA